MPGIKRDFLLLLALLSSITGFAQYSVSPVRHPDRYRLILPKEWNGHKLIGAITDILPQTIDELKDREFCTEGTAAFYVRLYIDSLTVTNMQTTSPVEIGSVPHYTFSFNYSFYAALLVTDSLENPVSRLQLISGEETMSYIKQFTLRPQNVVYRYQTIYDTRGRAIGRRLVEDAGAVNNYVPVMDANSVLSGQFLLSICEKKIYEIRRLLKKLQPD